MNNTKIVRGYPVYVYRRTNYQEQPKGTRVTKMMYDAENNRTLIYCRRPGVFIETLCLLIMIACVYANISYIHGMNVDFNYNSISTYYDGKLYLNLKNGDESVLPVDYELLKGNEVINRGILNPGEYLISIPIENVCDAYELRITYKTLFSENSETYRINVLDRSVKK